VGTFQYFAARGETERVRQLADYAIARHDPALAGDPDRFHAFFAAVARRQAELVASWMHVGFIHGVMNTDNMTISGETIDYGPCAFMEACDPAAVFSSIDHHGRYAFGNQPVIARWNLARLAETLLPLFHEDAEQAVARAMEVIEAFPEWFAQALLAGHRRKLGLRAGAQDPALLAEEDAALADDWLALMQAHKVDFTLGWRFLANAAEGDASRLGALFPPAADTALAEWLKRWRARLVEDGDEPGAVALRAASMRQVSPWIIPRNHRVEEALSAASEGGDMRPFEQLLEALRHPFEEDPGRARYAEPAPVEVTACYRTFCGT
jgi:uncharacterized protein YdiU (UPF0061 family)